MVSQKATDHDLTWKWLAELIEMSEKLCSNLILKQN